MSGRAWNRWAWSATLALAGCVWCTATGGAQTAEPAGASPSTEAVALSDSLKVMQAQLRELMETISQVRHEVADSRREADQLQIGRAHV